MLRSRANDFQWEDEQLAKERQATFKAAEVNQELEDTLVHTVLVYNLGA